MVRIIQDNFVTVLTCATILFCECLVYYVTLLPCDWPELSTTNPSHELRVLVLSDTHLLGPYRGHWFDKIRREWQMSMAFKVANLYHSPDTVVFLGDVFDEGQWVNAEEYSEYVKRFNYLFPTKNSIVLVGNHDVGFHYVMDQNKLRRFNKSFNISSADMLRFGKITFVTLNSMAMENDGCNICKKAIKIIRKIADNLNSQEKPILLQHFPLYRKSDETCDGDDSAPKDEKANPFREKFDCLSKESSSWLIKTLKPRLVLSGHTHHGCLYHHGDIPEYSVPSFSWRNRNNPSYFLLTVTPDDYSLSKCYLPEESTVISIYVLSALIIALTAGYRCYKKVIRHKERNKLP